MTSRTLKRLGVKLNPKPTASRGKNPVIRTSHGKIRYSAATAKRMIKADHLKDRVKKMRPYFGDGFKAKSGFDLRKVKDWTPAQRVKVTKYFRVIAPQIVQSHKPRYYRNSKNLAAAVEYTQQERLLPGQRAALFAAHPDETLRVKVRKGAVTVKRGARGGIVVRKATFDPQAFIEDPIREASRVMRDEIPGAKTYKLMMGPFESRGTFHDPGSVLDKMAQYIGRYEEYDSEDPMSHHPKNWMLGIIGYYGKRESINFNIEKARAIRDAEILARKHAKTKARAENRSRAIEIAIQKTEKRERENLKRQRAELKRRQTRKSRK